MWIWTCLKAGNNNCCNKTNWNKQKYDFWVLFFQFRLNQNHVVLENEAADVCTSPPIFRRAEGKTHQMNESRSELRLQKHQEVPIGQSTNWWNTIYTQFTCQAPSLWVGKLQKPFDILQRERARCLDRVGLLHRFGWCRAGGRAGKGNRCVCECPCSACRWVWMEYRETSEGTERQHGHVGPGWGEGEGRWWLDHGRLSFPPEGSWGGQPVIQP